MGKHCLFQRWISILTGNHATRWRPSCVRRLRTEPLERREMLSATAWADLSETELRIDAFFECTFDANDGASTSNVADDGIPDTFVISVREQESGEIVASVDINGWVREVSLERCGGMVIDGSSDDDLLIVGNLGTQLSHSFKIEFRGDKASSDVVKIWDTVGNDTFVASPDEATFVAANQRGYMVKAFDCCAVHCYAMAGGVDTAKFYGSMGDDVFYGDSQQAALFGEGYYNRAKFFEGVHAYSEAGGTDVAKLYGSTGDDIFFADPNQAALYGDGFYNRAKFFDEVYAEAGGGGDDIARMYGSEGDDHGEYLEGWLERLGTLELGTGARLSGEEYRNEAEGFCQVLFDGGPGGSDSICLTVSCSAARLEASPGEAFVEVPGYSAEATGFEQIHADTSVISWEPPEESNHDYEGRSAILYDSEGNDVLDLFGTRRYSLEEDTETTDPTGIAGDLSNFRAGSLALRDEELAWSIHVTRFAVQTKRQGGDDRVECHVGSSIFDWSGVDLDLDEWQDVPRDVFYDPGLCA